MTQTRWHNYVYVFAYACIYTKCISKPTMQVGKNIMKFDLSS